MSLATLGRADESAALAAPLLTSADDLVRIRALFAGGAPAILAGRAEQIAALAAALIGPSRDIEEQLPGAHNLVRTAYLCALLSLGRFPEIREFLGSFDPASHDSQAADFCSFTAVLGGVVALKAGKVETATHQLREAFDACRTAGSMHLGWAGGLLIEALATGGDAEAAEGVMGQLQDVPPVEPYDADRARSAAWITVARGDLPRARRELVEVADRTRDQGRVFNEVTALHDALRLGADEVAVRLATLAPHVDGEWAAALGAHAEAVLARDGSRLESAAAQFESLGLYLPAAETLGQAAAAFLASGEQVAANRTASRAAALLVQCEGASTSLTRRRPLPDPLTHRELEVALLAAEEHTSPQIAAQLYISVRTVDNLLQRVYRKLGITARTQLAGALAPLNRTE